MPVNFLDTVATSLLDALVDGLALATTGNDPPTRTYVAHGAPAWDGCGDCDTEFGSGGQAAVWLERVEHRPVTSQGGSVASAGCAVDPWGIFVLEWARCVPGLTEAGWPSEDNLDLSAGKLLIDLWAVLTEVYDRAATGPIAGMGCQGVEMGDATPLEPSGQCAGWSVRVAIGLIGFGPVGS